MAELALQLAARIVNGISLKCLSPSCEPFAGHIGDALIDADPQLSAGLAEICSTLTERDAVVMTGRLEAIIADSIAVGDCVGFVRAISHEACTSVLLARPNGRADNEANHQSRDKASADVHVILLLFGGGGGDQGEPARQAATKKKGQTSTMKTKTAVIARGIAARPRVRASGRMKVSSQIDL